VFLKTISLFFFGSLLLFNTFNYRIRKVLTREIQYEMDGTLFILFIIQILIWVFSSFLDPNQKNAFSNGGTNKGQ